jgi:hypothetical protein
MSQYHLHIQGLPFSFCCPQKEVGEGGWSNVYHNTIDRTMKAESRAQARQDIRKTALMAQEN